MLYVEHTTTGETFGAEFEADVFTLFYCNEYVDLSDEEVRRTFLNALRPTWRERIRRRLRSIWKWLWA